MRKTRSLANSNQMEEAQVVPFAFHTPTTTTRRNQKERRSLQSAATDDNGTPATWTLGLVFQQAIDRQDRILQTEGRFSLLEPLEYTLDTGIPPLLPDKDSSNDIDDMPCRHPLH